MPGGNANQTVVVGSEAAVECRAVGDRPVEVSWTRNGKAVGGGGKDGGGDGYSNRVWICEVKNSASERSKAPGRA